VSAKMARTQPDTEIARQLHLNTNGGIARHSIVVRGPTGSLSFAPDGLRDSESWILCTRPSELGRAPLRSATRIESPITSHSFRELSAMRMQCWL
jgi:hypothetical protein